MARRRLFSKDAKASGTDPLEASLRAINTALGGDMSRLGELFADAQVQKGLIPLLTGLEDYGLTDILYQTR